MGVSCGYIDTVCTARVEYSLTVECSVRLCLLAVQQLGGMVSLYCMTSEGNVFFFFPDFLIVGLE